MAGITPDPTLRVFVLPLSRRRSARIQVPRDIDDAGWDQMMAVMDAMKPGIIAGGEPDDGENPPRSP